MGYRARKIPCRSKLFHCGTKHLVNFPFAIEGVAVTFNPGNPGPA